MCRQSDPGPQCEDKGSDDDDDRDRDDDDDDHVDNHDVLIASIVVALVVFGCLILVAYKVLRRRHKCRTTRNVTDVESLAAARRPHSRNVVTDDVTRFTYHRVTHGSGISGGDHRRAKKTMTSNKASESGSNERCAHAHGARAVHERCHAVSSDRISRKTDSGENVSTQSKRDGFINAVDSFNERTHRG